MYLPWLRKYVESSLLIFFGNELASVVDALRPFVNVKNVDEYYPGSHGEKLSVRFRLLDYYWRGCFTELLKMMEKDELQLHDLIYITNMREIYSGSCTLLGNGAIDNYDYIFTHKTKQWVDYLLYKCGYDLMYEYKEGNGFNSNNEARQKLLTMFMSFKLVCLGSFLKVLQVVLYDFPCSRLLKAHKDWLGVLLFSHLSYLQRKHLASYTQVCCYVYNRLHGQEAENMRSLMRAAKAKFGIIHMCEQHEWE